MNYTVEIGALMDESGVKFGTSGARGLVIQMTDRVCAAYTLGFLGHLLGRGRIVAGSKVAISGDLRPSTQRIAESVCFAARKLGFEVEFCGWIPSPALVLHGIRAAIPTVMVTGSHIPDDRNGIKFSTPDGEVTKEDEAGILEQKVELSRVFNIEGMFADDSTRDMCELPRESKTAIEAYRARYLDAFPSGALKGLKVGVYGHSAVGREFLAELYETMGAEVLRLGWSETFVPVDTEAIRPEDLTLATDWAREHQIDSIVSTDGDSDRPLTTDERGTFFRGDVSGILTAHFFQADGVALPVSCNTAVEGSDFFSRILRTKIGSPYVISGMEELRAAGAQRVVGYEANGGFLSLSPLAVPDGKELSPLPTRDAVVVHLALLCLAARQKLPLSELLREIPQRVTASDRDQSFTAARSQKLLKHLQNLDSPELEGVFELGPVLGVSGTDGLRFIFQSGEILHLRASGNAPELRCYAEADSSTRANELVQFGLQVARKLAVEG